MDLEKKILDDLKVNNYESVKKVIEQEEMTPKKVGRYLKKVIKDAKEVRKKFRGYKSGVTKSFKSGKISEQERVIRNYSLDLQKQVLDDYIKYHKTKLNLEGMKGSKKTGKGRKQKGGNIMFFNDANQLLKKLELIIGEILAGNNSIKMRNTGVAILDMLLKMATINKPQYNKLYNQYFSTQ